jgi:hypothetical protein
MEIRYSAYIKGKSVKNTKTRITEHRYSFVITLHLDNQEDIVPHRTSLLHKESGIFDLPLNVYTPHFLTYKAFVRCMLWFLSHGMLNEKITVYTDDSKVGKQMVPPLPGKKPSKIPSGEDYSEESKKAKLHMELMPNLMVVPIQLESNNIAELTLTGGYFPLS